MSKLPTKLNAAEVEQFHREGYVGPFEAMPAEQMMALREPVAELLRTKPKPNSYPDKN